MTSTLLPPTSTSPVEAVGSPSTNKVLLRWRESYDTILELSPGDARQLLNDLAGSLNLLDYFASHDTARRIEAEQAAALEPDEDHPKFLD